MVSTASTACRPGQSARVAKTPASGQANTRRRTSRPWLSSNASKQGRSDPPSANAFAANQAFTSAWAFLPVALEGQQVVAAPGPVMRSAIPGWQASASRLARQPAQVEPVQQLGQDRQLAALAPRPRAGRGRSRPRSRRRSPGAGASGPSGGRTTGAPSCRRSRPAAARPPPAGRRPAPRRGTSARTRPGRPASARDGRCRARGCRSAGRGSPRATPACSGRRGRCPRSSRPRRGRRRPRSPGCRAAGARPSTRSAGPRSVSNAAIRASSMAFLRRERPSP